MVSISIITVVYNAAQTIEETIVSVINQSYHDFEYIIIDGGSSDGTIEIIKSYEQKISKWISEPDSGIYDAMNKAIKLASGDYLYFLGADDVLYNGDVLKNVAEKIKKRNTVMYGDVIFKNSGIRYDGPFGNFKMVTRNIAHQALFYPSGVFKVYQYNTKYKVFADYLLNLILFRDKRWAFEYIPLIIAIFNDAGISGSIVKDMEFENAQKKIIKRTFPYIYYLYRILRSKLAALVKSK